MPNATGYEYFDYDAENRLVRATQGNNPDFYEQYRYGLDNRRLWGARQQGEGNRSEWAYFYGAYGELLGGRIYFGGRLIGRGGYVGEVILTDRLGSVGGPGKYYPYGQERQATQQETAKFATYFRDATGLDYAWNRHYTSTWGRFMQADPYLSPDALKNPQGWNRYAYVENDPVNFHDPQGLQRYMVTVYGRHIWGYPDDGGLRWGLWWVSWFVDEGPDGGPGGGGSSGGRGGRRFGGGRPAVRRQRDHPRLPSCAGRLGQPGMCGGSGIRKRRSGQGDPPDD